MPVLNQTLNFDYYSQWYTGFANGLTYTSPGIYNLTIFDDTTELFVDNEDCQASNPPPNLNYDPRCRDWYKLAIESDNRNEVVLTEPYLGLRPDNQLFLTLASYNYQQGVQMGSVAAFDLNLNGTNSVFHKFINEYLLKNPT